MSFIQLSFFINTVIAQEREENEVWLAEREASEAEDDAIAAEEAEAEAVAIQEEELRVRRLTREAERRNLEEQARIRIIRQVLVRIAETAEEHEELYDSDRTISRDFYDDFHTEDMDSTLEYLSSDESYATYR